MDPINDKNLSKGKIKLLKEHFLKIPFLNDSIDSFLEGIIEKDLYAKDIYLDSNIKIIILKNIKFSC
jgi:hypothetical protein